MAKECFRLGMAALGATEAGDVYLVRIPLFGLLGNVGETGSVAQGFDLGRRDIHVIGGRKHHGVVGDFVKVERCLFVGGEPSVENEL